MADSLKENGWTVRFRFRTLKYKRVKNGRTRGRYEGKYVYIRATSPAGEVRELYLGTTSTSRSSTSGSRGRKRRAGELELHAGAQGRKRGQKAREIAAYCDDGPLYTDEIRQAARDVALREYRAKTGRTRAGR